MIALIQYSRPIQGLGFRVRVDGGHFMGGFTGLRTTGHVGPRASITVRTLASLAQGEGAALTNRSGSGLPSPAQGAC